MKNTDLHIHSIHSDGLLKPKEIVKLAKSKNLKCISLTDHNSITGLKECEKYCRKYKIEFIPGIEMYSDKTEILGYFIDHQNKELLKTIKTIESRATQRTKKIIKNLNKININITFNELIKFSNKKAPQRPHLARLLIKKGYVKDKKEAFSKYLTKGTKTYVKIKKPFTPKQIIKIIKKAKGLPILAHPQFSERPKILFKKIPKLIKIGLIGIETTCPCPKEKLPILKKAKEIAKKYKLIETGGSDFHSLKEKSNLMGDYNIDYEAVEKLKALL